MRIFLKLTASALPCNPKSTAAVTPNGATGQLKDIFVTHRLFKSIEINVGYKSKTDRIWDELIP